MSDLYKNVCLNVILKFQSYYKFEFDMHRYFIPLYEAAFETRKLYKFLGRI
jgi:hypothetical protein